MLFDLGVVIALCLHSFILQLFSGCQCLTRHLYLARVEYTCLVHVFFPMCKNELLTALAAGYLQHTWHVNYSWPAPDSLVLRKFPSSRKGLHKKHASLGSIVEH